MPNNNAGSYKKELISNKLSASKPGDLKDYLSQFNDIVMLENRGDVLTKPTTQIGTYLRELVNSKINHEDAKISISNKKYYHQESRELFVTAKQILSYWQNKVDVRLLLKASVDSDLKAVLNEVISQEPYDMLEAMKAHILNHTTAKLENCKTRLRLIVWDDKRSTFKEFSKEHETLVNDIINMGCQTTWDDRTLSILQKLPASYFDFGAALKMQKDVGTLKVKSLLTLETRTDQEIYNFVKGQITSLEETKKLKNIGTAPQPPRQTANFTSNDTEDDVNTKEPASHYNSPHARKKKVFKREANKTPRFNGTCGYCNKPGHKSDVCFAKTATCKLCSKTGHFAKDCHPGKELDKANLATSSSYYNTNNWFSKSDK